MHHLIHLAVWDMLFHYQPPAQRLSFHALCRGVSTNSGGEEDVLRRINFREDFMMDAQYLK